MLPDLLFMTCKITCSGIVYRQLNTNPHLLLENKQETGYSQIAFFRNCERSAENFTRKHLGNERIFVI